jgi:hypothetical protein
VLSSLLIIASIWARFYWVGFESRDLTLHILPWYRNFISNGVRNGLATGFSNYTPPYLYLLALTTKINLHFPEIAKIKAIGWLLYNGQNFFAFIPNTVPKTYSTGFVLLAVLIVLAWIYFTFKNNRLKESSQILLVSLCSVTLAPSMLPYIHERYFFLSETISLALAINNPKFWFVPIAFQVATYLVYSNYLFENINNDYERLIWSTFITLSLLGFILWSQMTNLFQNR